MKLICPHSHVKYTIPPALLLTYLLRPLRTRLDVYKILFLQGVAVAATIPWDSYLLKQRIWGYPAHAVLGVTLWRIPVEELFFFVIQTYNTSLLYLLLSKPVLHVAYLNEIAPGSRAKAWWQRSVGAAVAGVGAWSVLKAAEWVKAGGEGTYMGLIWVWAGPVMLGIWSLSYRHILSLPARTTLLPIIIPTLYLWTVDTLALRKGTWVINAGTKLNIHLWPALEIEEAVFFLLTNVMIVIGLVAVDYALALEASFPSLYPATTPFWTCVSAAGALFRTSFPRDEYAGIPASVDLLRRKSRSFYLASAVFEGRLRLDLISLYAFCRAADDLIDDSPDPAGAAAKLEHLLQLAYTPAAGAQLRAYITTEFPQWSHTALLALPVHKLPRKPLMGLLHGFTTDLKFTSSFPISDESALAQYAYDVAGTVGQMFTHLVLHHHPAPTSTTSAALLDAATTMGTALQYVNIARDIGKDAKIGRVYIPTTWLAAAGLTPADVVRDPQRAVAAGFRGRLVGMAETLYSRSRGAVEELPEQARGGARVAVESYMDIGRRLEGGAGAYTSADDQAAAATAGGVVAQGKEAGNGTGAHVEEDTAGKGGTGKWRNEGWRVKAVRMWRAWRVLSGSV
ncbi:Lycopene beta-cyclase [Geopyxis carbonaria]|nr:Lycopene beta-cyclase [Geopyxis carbonaria]